MLYFLDCIGDFRFIHHGLFNVSVSDYTSFLVTDDNACACKCSLELSCVAYALTPNFAAKSCVLYKTLGDILPVHYSRAYIKNALEPAPAVPGNFKVTFKSYWDRYLTPGPQH